MKINVLDLKLGKEKSIPISYEHIVKDEDLKDKEYKALSPMKINGTIKLIDNIYVFLGEFNITLEFVCDRCLENFVCDLEAEIHEEFKENVLENDDYYSKVVNNEINLEEVLLRNLFVNIPIKLICSEDCEGIQYNNLAKEEENNNPFSKLKNLKFD